MLEGKAMIQDTDMPLKMQIQAMASASQALDHYDVVDCKSIAAHIKKDFDKNYGSGWQCVDPSSTLNWRLSISSSSKGLLPPPLTEAKGSVSTKFKRKAEDGGKSAPHFSDAWAKFHNSHGLKSSISNWVYFSPHWK
nr:dynein light chain lc6, flagellar outer arm [Quercus suber]